MEDMDAHGAPLTIERGAFKGGSTLIILILSCVTAFCVYVVGRMVREGSVDPVAWILFSAFPIIALPLLAWEIKCCLPARLEISSHSAKYYFNGKLKDEITFGPSVKADVRLNSDRTGPEPKAFHSSCDEDTLTPPREKFLLLCGISFVQGDRTIALSHDDGWRLIDFSEVWDRFLSTVVEHEMEMGSELWRYIEFRDGFTELGEDVEPDIFTRIRAMEH